MEKWKVLLVDDEEEFVATLAERLELRGIRSFTATQGDNALQLVEKERPDAVVLDVMMPGLGGLEVLKRIKEGWPEIQVVLLTGRGSTTEAEDGLRLGAFDYLIKPLRIEELIRKIKEAVGDPAEISPEGRR
jgi:DNA-binding response OmpR family regulator